MPQSSAIGFLAIVSTPIGNLADISYRAIDILKQADLIAVEDTRKAQRLLNHYQIKCSMIPYHDHNEHRKTAYLLQAIKSGKNIALLSDAGTPCIADPGYLLIREAHKENINPLIIPGASALTYTLTACNLPVNRFIFIGFLARRSNKRRRQIQELSSYNMTLILFESPHRLNKLLLDIQEILNPETEVVLIREATKYYEEQIRGSAAELVKRYSTHKWKGELTVAVAPQTSV